MPELLTSVFEVKGETSLENFYCVVQYTKFCIVSFTMIMVCDVRVCVHACACIRVCVRESYLLALSTAKALFWKTKRNHKSEFVWTQQYRSVTGQVCLHLLCSAVHSYRWQYWRSNICSAVLEWRTPILTTVQFNSYTSAHTGMHSVMWTSSWIRYGWKSEFPDIF